MKRLAGFLFLIVLCSGCWIGAAAQTRMTNSQVRASQRAEQKANRKQQKAMKKYAKAQRKAQRKMEKLDRKNTHLPPRRY